MGQFNEMSLDQLYHSTVRAFPNTTKRQHITDTIKVVKIDWTPFVGMNTLFVKGLVENEGKMYDTIFLFKGIRYETGKDSIPLMASDGMTYHLSKIDEANQDVLVRCNCPDFKWRWNYYNHSTGSLWGAKVRKYESQGGPPANPKELPGMCKHCLKTVRALSRAGIFVQ